MREKILFVGGVVNVLAVLFHLALPRLAVWQRLSGGASGTQQGYLHLFNAHVAYAFLVFAVLSLGYPRELLSTLSGRTITLLIGGFWVLRAASEFIWLPKQSPLILVLSLSMASLYVIVAFGNGRVATTS